MTSQNVGFPWNVYFILIGPEREIDLDRGGLRGRKCIGNPYLVNSYKFLLQSDFIEDIFSRFKKMNC